MSPTSYRTALLRDMVGVQGFEPRLTGPKPVVLPLDDTPKKVAIIVKQTFKIALNKKTAIMQAFISRDGSGLH